MAPREELAKPKDGRIHPLGLVVPPPLEVACPAFTGSLATLFECVRAHRVDLMEVPLGPICEAYFAYLLGSPEVDHDAAAAALVALAYLLERKAWALLPVPEPEPEMDDHLELEMPLPTTDRFACAIESLQLFHEERNQRYFRRCEPEVDYQPPLDLGSVTIHDLSRALKRLLDRAKPDSVMPLSKPRRSLSDQMRIVLQALGPTGATLDSVVPEPFTREEAVWWFLSLLELIRLGQVVVSLKGDDVLFALRRRGSS